MDKDPKLKCYMACAYSKFDVLFINGTIDFDEMFKFIETITDEEARTARMYAFNVCKDKVKYTTWCRTGYELAKCQQLATPKVNLSVFYVDLSVILRAVIHNDIIWAILSFHEAL